MGGDGSCNNGNCQDSGSSAHSPQIGWAADGFPIYGPRGPSGTMMKTCTVTGGTYGTAICTDACGGYYKDDGSIDQFKYRYYMQGPYNDGLSCNTPNCPSGDANYYPNSPNCYRGCCPSGATCSGFGRFTLPTCGGSANDGYRAGYTASTTSSNGANGAGTDVANGLQPYNTAVSGSCACASLQCGTCSSATANTWTSTSCPAGGANDQTCTSTSFSGSTSDASKNTMLAPAMALAMAAAALAKQWQ